MVWGPVFERMAAEPCVLVPAHTRTLSVNAWIAPDELIVPDRRGKRATKHTKSARIDGCLVQSPLSGNLRSKGRMNMPVDHGVLPKRLAIIALGLSLFVTAAGSRAAADDGRTTADGNTQPGLESIRMAVVRALPLLIKASAEEYPKHRDCFSCHNQAVPAVALSLARQRKYAVGEPIIRAIAEHTEADLAGALDDYQKGRGQPGGVIRAGYALWTLEAAGWKHDETTSAVAHYLSTVLGRRDHWAGQSSRPPSEFSDFTATALALRGLNTFCPRAPSSPTNGDRNHSTKQPTSGSQAPSQPTWRARSLVWLRQAKPRETEDRVFRLWGLKQVGASAQELAAAAADLLGTQRPDGGWSQLDPAAGTAKAGDKKGQGIVSPHPRTAQVSDAYATGSALVALHLAGGVSTDLPAYRNGLHFLIRSQHKDGSWLIKSRSKPFQTYFESGFPHGPDQFISAAGTAWAVAALVLACPAA